MSNRFIAGIACALVVVLAALTPPPSQPNRAPHPSVPAVVPAWSPGSGTPLAFIPEGSYPQTINSSTYNRYRGPNLSWRVVLTYDDCPNDLTALTAVLRYARTQGIGLVFAPTGKCHEKFKAKYKVDIAQLIRAHGQYAINHSYSHPNFTRRTPANIRWQLSREVKADYGRPPYGARNAKVDAAYKAVGMRQWLWNVDTRDWDGKSENQVVDHVARHATAGSTVLMHMNHKGFSPHAIGTIQGRLRAKNLELCRPFRGWANPPGGPVQVAPAKWGNNALPC